MVMHFGMFWAMGPGFRISGFWPESGRFKKTGGYDWPNP